VDNSTWRLSCGHGVTALLAGGRTLSVAGDGMDLPG